MRNIKVPQGLKLTGAQQKLVDRNNEIVTVTEAGNKAKIKKLVLLTARENTLLTKVVATIKEFNAAKKAGTSAKGKKDVAAPVKGKKEVVSKTTKSKKSSGTAGVVTLVGQALQQVKGVLSNVTDDGIELVVKQKRTAVTIPYAWANVLSYAGAGIGEEVTAHIYTHSSTVYTGQIERNVESDTITVTASNGAVVVLNANNAAGIEVQVVYTEALEVAEDDDEDEDDLEDDDEDEDEDEDEDDEDEDDDEDDEDEDEDDEDEDEDDEDEDEDEDEDDEDDDEDEDEDDEDEDDEDDEDEDDDD